MLSLMLHELRLRRRAIVGWTIGLAFFASIYAAFYPALPEEMRSLDVESIDIYRSLGVETMATFEGYLQSSVLNFLPLLVGAFGIVLGVGALAGEEEAGTLENIAALPVSRLQLYGAKASAVTVAAFGSLVAVALVLAVVFLAIESEIDTTITAAGLFWTVLASVLVAVAFLALGLLFGAFLPSRGSALAAAAIVLVATFFANNLAGLVTELEPIRPLTPSYHYGEISGMLTGDVPWANVGALVVMALLALGLGAVGFQRRDLTVGAWPWQRWPARESVGREPSAAPSRRALAPLAVVALVGCVCVSSAAVAINRSDDLDASLRERLGLDSGTVLEGSAELSTALAVVTAPVSGRITAVDYAVGDEVDSGAAVASQAEGPDSALYGEAQGVLEAAWAFVDEMSTGSPSEGLEATRDRVGLSEDLLVGIESAWREALASGDSADLVAELAVRADLARAVSRIAEARLALAEGRLAQADLQAVEMAISEAESILDELGAAAGTREALAPIAGTVVALRVAAGQVVAEGDPVAEITGTGALEIAVRASGDDVEGLGVDDRVTIEVDGHDAAFGGVVVAIDESAAADREGAGAGDDEDTLPFVVTIRVEDPDGRLTPGEVVGVRVRSDES